MWHLVDARGLILMDQFLDKYVFPYTDEYIGRSRTTKDGLPVYTRREELFNAVSHGIGVVMGLAVILASIFRARSEFGMIGGIIFGVALFVLYASSSAYHGTPAEDVSDKKVLRVIDHCSIFVLVAGTCAPIVLRLIAETSDQSEWVLYGVIWALALGGVALLCVDIERFKSLATVMYVVMGALVVMRAGEVWAIVGSTGALLLLAGALAYLVGLLFYGLGTRREWMHSVFHVLCLAGSVLHAVCICGFVI